MDASVSGRREWLVPALYSAGMILLLIVFGLAGDNGFVYLLVLLGVPVASGILSGLMLIRFWHAVVGCVAVVVLDVVVDDTRAQDVVFFVVVAAVMVGLAWLTDWLTRWAVRRRRAGTGLTA